MKTYVTFGQVHVHSVDGKTFDKDSIAVVHYTGTPDKGREEVFRIFGPTFGTTYTEEQWESIGDMMKYFPRGFINANQPIDNHLEETFAPITEETE